MQNIAKSPTSGSTPYDPVAAKFLELSSKKLSPYFGEPICIGRFVQAVLDREYLKQPVSEADSLLIALDALTFHLQNVQGNVEYQNRCYDAFTNLITTSDLDRWFDEVEDINRSIKQFVLAQNTDPNIAKQFGLAQNQYIQSIKQDRLGYLAEETVTLNLRRNQFHAELDGALNNTKSTGGSRIRVSVEDNFFGGHARGVGNGSEAHTVVYKGFKHGTMSVD